MTRNCTHLGSRSCEQIQLWYLPEATHFSFGAHTHLGCSALQGESLTWNHDACSPLGAGLARDKIPEIGDHTLSVAPRSETAELLEVPFTTSPASYFQGRYPRN